jgi:cleavage stimulation factor subunit 1
MFASASTDGSIKIWDAVNFSCVRTLDHAHNGEPISSVQFSRDGKHLLSGGLDKQARIWEISTGKEILTFGNEDKGKFSMSARYTFGEDQIIIADETSPNVFLYNAKTGELSSQLEGHSSHVRNISVSPVEHSFISCGDDSRARFWSI